MNSIPSLSTCFVAKQIPIAFYRPTALIIINTFFKVEKTEILKKIFLIKRANKDEIFVSLMKEENIYLHLARERDLSIQRGISFLHLEQTAALSGLPREAIVCSYQQHATSAHE